ncbi:MAG: TetR/AcrR family transcriptional regulator [Hyphomicrobiaceae bacterium]
MSKRLGKDAWVVAGLKALADHGVDGVRIERLAEALGVTKGSFYWHFADRQALLTAVLVAWKARATADIIVQVEAKGCDPRERMHELMMIVFTADGRLERQVRAWAANDEAARLAQDEIDGERTRYLEGLFTGLGFKRAEARARSRFAYHALIGQFALSDGGKGKRAAAELELVFEMMVTRGIA